MHPALCFDGEIRQVISNLVGNELTVSGKGGRLLVRSREGTNWKTGEKGVFFTGSARGRACPGIRRQRYSYLFLLRRDSAVPDLDCGSARKL